MYPKDVESPKYRRIKLTNEKFHASVVCAGAPVGLQILTCGPALWRLSTDGKCMDSVGNETMMTAALSSNMNRAMATGVWTDWVERYASFVERVAERLLV